MENYIANEILKQCKLNNTLLGKQNSWLSTQCLIQAYAITDETLRDKAIKEIELTKILINTSRE